MRALFLAVLFLLPLHAFAETCDDAGKIYRICSDQKKIFDEAMEKAKAENKMMVVSFGADWCPWCRSLHTLLSADDETKKIAGDAVMFEVGLYQDQEKVPTGWAVLDEVAAFSKKRVNREGIPLLAVINPLAEKAEFLDTAKFEKNTKVSKGHDPKKLAAAVKKGMAAVK